MSFCRSEALAQMLDKETLLAVVDGEFSMLLLRRRLKGFSVWREAMDDSRRNELLRGS